MPAAATAAVRRPAGATLAAAHGAAASCFPSASAGAAPAAGGLADPEYWLARLSPPADQDAELALDVAAWEAAGRPVPADLEPFGSGLLTHPDPEVGPPDGNLAWLAGLPPELLDEYLAASGGASPARTLQSGFASGGAAETLPPGAVLASLAENTWSGGLARLGEDELAGLLRAGRRLASWAAALELAAAADLMRRREEYAAATGDTGPAEHAGDEIAAALTLTMRAADRQLGLAMSLRRLPGTAAALAAGEIDLPRAAVIVGETSGLSDEHAAAVEQRVLPAAPGQNTSRLGAAARRAVMAADPAAARIRKQQAERDARVERWLEHAGTAALAGRDLPPAAVLAADQHLTALAEELRAAGVPGTMDNLRAQVYLSLLAGEPLTTLLPSASPPAGPAAAGVSAAGASTVPTAFAPPAAASTAFARPAALRGAVNLTMPLATWLGFSDAPGQAGGFGPLDAPDSRALGAALAARGNHWCLTLTDQAGRPVAHGCSRAGPDPGGGSWTFTIRLLAGRECSHARQTAAYRPPAKLRHVLTVRHRSCTFPGCGRPAARCDLDHTQPFDQGGRTCECNLAPLCRHHHRCKQSEGWQLEQPEPGVLVWRTPARRIYTTTPAEYPV